MTKIIRPKFERRLSQRLRMLRAKPSLKSHPEFENTKEIKILPLITILAGFVALMSIFRRK